MKRISEADWIDALNWRYATKQFDSEKKIDPATWEVLEKSLVLSPSSFGLQPWRFLVVNDPAVRESLLPLAWGQRQVVDASHLVVIAAKDEVNNLDVAAFIDRTVEVTGAPRERLEGFEKMIAGFVSSPPYPLDLREWSRRQAYIALGFLMSGAAALGVDTCPMEGIDPAGFDKTLGLEGSGYSTVVACTLGFRSATDKYATNPKIRYEHASLVSHIG